MHNTMPAGFCLANTFQKEKDDRSNLESVHPTPAIANALNGALQM